MRNCTLAFFLLVPALSGSVSAADFTVTNTNTSGAGSFAQAITDANNLPGADRVLFNIPGAGVHKIDVSQTPLPVILESLFIDGYSQPGAKPNSLAVGNNAVILIQLDGGAIATQPSTGLQLEKGQTPDGLPSNYTVRGLSLTGFVSQTQFDITSGGYAVGGSSFDAAVIAGNFIGLLPDGASPRSNYQGVNVTSTGAAIVGGTDPASRNVISGNTFGFTGGAVVQGNYIGTNASGTKAVPNATGILLVGDRSDTIIGGTASGAGNLISGNIQGLYMGTGALVRGFIYKTSADNARIKGNLIGVQADGVRPLPNDYAITILFGSNNTIGGLEPGASNLLAFNRSGINVARPYSTGCGICGEPRDPASEGNQILSNAIYANAGLGIDLGSDTTTPNDLGDPDQGPNTFQNAPVIGSAVIANGSVTIKGTLNSTANTQFTLQYFSESLDLVRPVQTYLGTSNVMTDAVGNAQFSTSFPITDASVSFNMTATSQAGNTSEFARNAGRMQNISTRTLVQSGDNTPIAGFIVSGDAYLIVRALGPSLRQDHHLAGALEDPTLEVYDSTGKLIASNDNWRDFPNASGIEQLGLAPTNDLESALALLLPSGNYTAVVRGAQGASGLGLVEVYGKQFSPNQVTGEMVNLSTRGVVQTGDNVMIAGLIIEQVAGSTRMVARALGPSLAAAGITNPLPDPMLELYDAQGALIASNDNWRDGQADDLTAVGLAPSKDNEAAIFMRVASGAYTAIVRGKGNSSGIALVEVYDLH